MKKIAFLVFLGLMGFLVVNGCKKEGEPMPEVSTNAPAVPAAPATNAPAP